MRFLSASTAATTDHRRVIAIDGPAGAGKSTVARMLADRLGALFFDTGALYRAVALLAIRTGTKPSDATALCRLAKLAVINVRPPTRSDGRLYDVLLNGEDVTWNVRDADIGAVVSEVAEQPAVRAALLPLQRKIATEGPVVMVGRDIGTVVVPDAGLKVYLDASPEERARRRFRETTARGGQETYQETLQETLHRDQIDSTRETAPLRPAPDAIQIRTDDLSVPEVVNAIEERARAITSPTGERLWQ